MKNTYRYITALVCALFICTGLFAQEVAAPTVGAQDIGSTLIESLVAKYPVISSILLIVGLLRAIFKPIVSAYEAYVKQTPDTKDDEQLATAEKSWWFRALLWLLDFGASVRAPKR